MKYSSRRWCGITQKIIIIGHLTGCAIPEAVLPCCCPMSGLNHDIVNIKSSYYIKMTDYDFTPHG